MITPSPSLARVALACLAIGLAACSSAVTSAQSERNNALWTVARSCENGSLKVERISNEGKVYTSTMNSSGYEFPPFQKCYSEKAGPIWQSYCTAEPDSPQCKR